MPLSYKPFLTFLSKVFHLNNPLECLNESIDPKENGFNFQKSFGHKRGMFFAL